MTTTTPRRLVRRSRSTIERLQRRAISRGQLQQIYYIEADFFPMNKSTPAGESCHLAKTPEYQSIRGPMPSTDQVN
jgi:hypothetical protein